MVLHKWYVLIAGVLVGAPIWRLLVHDFSKFGRAEWGPYVRWFYFRKSDKRRKASEFSEALEHHYRRNDHHPQWWGGAEMSEDAVLEMVADWMGASKVKLGHWDIRDWYEKAKLGLELHPTTRARVEELMEVHTHLWVRG